MLAAVIAPEVAFLKIKGERRISLTDSVCQGSLGCLSLNYTPTQAPESSGAGGLLYMSDVNAR